MKKTIWIIIIALIAVTGVWLFYTINNSVNKGTGITDSLKSLFPYGISDYTSSSTTATTNSLGVNIPDQTGDTAVSYNPLVQLSNRSAVGMTVLAPSYIVQDTATSSNSFASSTSVSRYQSTILYQTKLPIVRFAERGTGYIYDIDARGKNEAKQTGTTIVRAYESYFGDNGNSIIFRYLKSDNNTIATFLGKIIPPASNTSGDFATIKGDFLPDDITNLVVSPDGKKFGYILPNQNGVAGIAVSSDGINKQQLFTSSFSEWLLDWKAGGLTATTKAASGIPGFVYNVKNTGIFEKIIGGIDGMTTNLSPDGKNLLYNTSSKGKVNLFIRHSNGDSSKMDIATLSEKCVWSKASVIIYCAVPAYFSPGETYPDSWYQGTAHFIDQIWKIDSSFGTAIKVSDLESKAIDAVDLQLDVNENFLIFRNNNDGTPWSLDLKKVSANKIVPTLGTEPIVDR
jgi:hypothetical protein